MIKNIGNNDNSLNTFGNNSPIFANNTINIAVESEAIKILTSKVDLLLAMVCNQQKTIEALQRKMLTT